jgi:hypothetical protein
MYLFFKKFPILFALFILTINVPVSAKLVEIAALVEMINVMPMSHVYVYRSGKKLEVVPMMSLQAGDLLHIRQSKNNSLKDKQNYVLLTLGKDESAKITFKQSPYWVKKRESPLMIPDNQELNPIDLFKSIYEKFRKAASMRSVETKSLLIPLLKNTLTQMVTGERRLHLAWQNRRAPYWVYIFQKNNTIAKLSSTKRVLFAKQKWQPGHYPIEISDANGNKDQGIFQVLNKLPFQFQKMEQEIQASTLPEWAKQTLFAAWLTQQENGMWKLEAYQRVVGIANKYQPALLVKKDLENME